jgi:lysophospholipid acyltransferase (LPLAT)-like uncharacterized protein
MLVRLLLLTVRLRVSGGDTEAGRHAVATGVVYVLWHNSLMLPLRHPICQGTTALISPGKDGDFAVGVLSRFGIAAVRGSTSRRAAKALLSFREGRPALRYVVTPDGPRGPRYSFRSGCVWMASQLGYPIVPIGIAATRAWHLRSWDRFRIPKPFSRVEMVFGEPIVLSRALRRSEVLALSPSVEAALATVAAQAARKAGHPWPD